MGGWAQAVGLLMGTGNVGAHLDESFDAINTYGVPSPPSGSGPNAPKFRALTFFVGFYLFFFSSFFFYFFFTLESRCRLDLCFTKISPFFFYEISPFFIVVFVSFFVTGT